MPVVVFQLSATSNASASGYVKLSLCQALGQSRWAKKANEKRKKRASSEKASERFFALFFHPFSPLSWSVEQAKLNSATRLLSNLYTFAKHQDSSQPDSLPSKISLTFLFDMRRLRLAMKNYRISLTLRINSFSNINRWGVVLAKTEPADHDLVNLHYKTPRILRVLRTQKRSNKCPGARVKTK